MLDSQVGAVLSLIRTNAELEDLGKPTKELCLNRVFIGNPGTGWYQCDGFRL